MISVVIPVGPAPGHTRWLKECLDSVWAQTMQPSEVLLIDDMANLDLADNRLRVHRNPWICGVAHSYNFGVSLARSECVFMIASDDLLYPKCLEECWRTYQVNNQKDAYYYVGVEYMDDRQDKFQTVPCNTAMVTKRLWKLTGGFPIQSSHGANDAALISIMIRHMSGLLIPVAHGTPLAKMRTHSDQFTSKPAYWQGIIMETRNHLTTEWKEPQWGRYIP
jgi:glycosyltransferase involved in cell wall biosynthesis